MEGRPNLLSPEKVRKWTTLIPGRNLVHILVEHAVVLSVFGFAVLVFENRQEWEIPIWMLMILSVMTFVFAGIQSHRIALLGHESSHHLLFKNRMWNDLIADLLCFFPIWSSLLNYRTKHNGHHLHPNEPYKDPNLGSDRSTRLFQSFPMEKPSSIFRYYALFFWPPFVIGNLLEIVRILFLGEQRSDSQPKKKRPLYCRPGVLGVFYGIGLILLLSIAKSLESPFVMIVGPLTFYLVFGVMAVLLIPRSVFDQAGGSLSYPRKVSALLRLTFCSAILIGTTWCRFFTGIHIGLYYFVFWLLPLFYVLPYLMLLREIYQHANLGVGKLDNSRIIHADWFTRWALLPYGNDLHLIHHIYPNIPHYHLMAVHEELLATSEAYRRELVEVSGTVQGRNDHHSVSESLAFQR